MDITSYLLGKQAGGGGSATLETDKEVSVTSNGTTTINPSSGYDGMKKVSLTTNVQPNLESKSVTINSNTTTDITPTSGKDGLSSVSVTTNVQPNLQNKSITIDENGTTTVSADDGYDGLGTITITTDVGGGGSGIDEYTQLLLHFEQNYTDSSEYVRQPSGTQTNLVYDDMSNSHPGFGYAFNLTDVWKGLLSYTSIKSFIENSFTIDFWIYPTTFANSDSSSGRPIMGQYTRNDWWVGWSVHMCEYQGSNNKWGMNYSYDENHSFNLISTTALTQNTWQHLAVTYNKSNRKVALWLNGTKDAEITLDYDIALPGGDIPQLFSIGNWWSNRQYQPYCYIDEVRISSTVRYTSNFTPPTAPYGS